MNRNDQVAPFLLCVCILSGCNTSLNSGVDRNAPLQLSMREIAQDELTLTAPGDVTFECDRTLNDVALAQWLSSAGVESSCENAIVLNNFTGLSNDCGTTGLTTVTWTATDDCGNTVSQTATFAVVDSTLPSIDGPADVTVDCEGVGTAQLLQEWLDSVVTVGENDVAAPFF